MADLGRQALEAGGRQRDHLKQISVPIARAHLRRDRLTLEPEALKYAQLESGSVAP